MTLQGVIILFLLPNYRMLFPKGFDKTFVVVVVVVIIRITAAIVTEQTTATVGRHTVNQGRCHGCCSDCCRYRCNSCCC